MSSEFGSPKLTGSLDESDLVGNARDHSLVATRINDLPVELLICIFEDCLEEDPDSLENVCLVNRRWNEIILTTPTLWQHLKLSDQPFEPHYLRAKARRWLSRSKHLPLDVEFDVHYRDSVLPLVSYVLPDASRWRHTTFGLSSTIIQFVGKRRVSESVGMCIVLHPKDNLMSDIGETAAENGSDRGERQQLAFNGKGRSIESITVTGVCSLPDPNILEPFTSITRLYINNIGEFKDIPMHQVVHFLHAFPNLQEMELGNLHVQNAEYRENCPHIQPALLPRLLSLKLVATPSTRCLLSHIITPKLSTISLIHINSSLVWDFPLPGDPGDSEDEARDFSRSPWTDHATGMGLRSLLSKSYVPIEHLNMDYADLRTKDFKWAFSTLRDLRFLRVVASDMSDNAARALHVSKCHQPLPKLTDLRLCKCHKLSGDAIVAMVESRMKGAEEGLVESLQRIELIECSGFTPLHHFRLLEKYGMLYVNYTPGFDD